MADQQKTFSYHWGNGIVAEEAQFESEWSRPTIQLLRYTDEENEGTVNVRFCSYSLNGRFSRSPLLLGADQIEGLREALRQTPELRELLRRLVD